MDSSNLHSPLRCYLIVLTFDPILFSLTYTVHFFMLQVCFRPNLGQGCIVLVKPIVEARIVFLFSSSLKL